MILINLHNNHHDLGTPRIVQMAIAKIDNIERAFASLDDIGTVLCFGDWNDPDGKFLSFRPFELLDSHHRGVVVYCADPPKSCCSTSGRHWPNIGDYVLANVPTRHSIVWPTGDASDHLPVLIQGF